MRIGIFDGILETHLGSSLTRSLRKRGHQVLNTGKIGHGFKFPEVGITTEHLEVAVRQIIDFDADICFVMRPASLPPKILSKLKRQGITMVAWFSDDPVLFELSYAPIVELYDIVLHCGTARVLDFYENRFGRPTGVNFPFWTDHESFPAVWGANKPTTDFLFLGNVQDEVRRDRYFELANLKGSVRIHGNVGSDYFGVSGGYLDSNEEVLASGACTKVALNIPQFFKNHKGLDTWFKGLGDLGFFEYPSRVIQYMAMGIPTISIVSGIAKFRSYPEMAVVEDIRGADEVLQQWENEGSLKELSENVLGRFDRNFSADSRVLALEFLLEDDSWKKLDPFEREVWFTQFDGRDLSGEGAPKEMKILPEIKNIESDGKTKPKIIVLGYGDPSVTSRSVSSAAILQSYGFEVEVRDALKCDRLIVQDPSRKCKYALNPKQAVDLFGGEGGILVCADVPTALTSVGAQVLRESGVKSVAFYDEDRTDFTEVARICEYHNLVITGNKYLYEGLKRRNVENLEFIPFMVNPRYFGILDELDSSKAIVKVQKDQATENSLAPCFMADINQAEVDNVYSYSELERMDLHSLAKCLKTDVALISFGGSRNKPRISPITPYIVFSSNFVFVNRVPEQKLIHPYELVSTATSNPGELYSKSTLLTSNEEVFNLAGKSRELGMGILMDAPKRFYQTIRRLVGQELNTGLSLLKKNSVIDLSQQVHWFSENPNGVRIDLETRFVFGDNSDWLVSVAVDGTEVYEEPLSSFKGIYVRNVSGTASIKVGMKYLRSAKLVVAKDAVDAVAILGFRKDIVLGKKHLPRVMTIETEGII